MKRMLQQANQRGSLSSWPAVHCILALANLVLLAAIAFSTGCSSTSQQAANRYLQKEAVLQQCGFKAIQVTTPEQVQRMSTLPPGKISVVQRNGNRYYVFPDQSRQMLYVGRDDQYLRYQNYL